MFAVAVAEQALEWASDSPQRPSPGELEPMEIIPTPAAKELAANPYLDIPSPSQSQEFKKGYIMRKCCVEPGGKRTALGKRNWRMYFAVLKDLVLYLYKDEATCKGEQPAKSDGTAARCRKGAGASSEPGPAAVIRVHHALAASAPDYTKKKNVFRLFTADRAQYLVQASDTKVSTRTVFDQSQIKYVLIDRHVLRFIIDKQFNFTMVQIVTFQKADRSKLNV